MPFCRITAIINRNVLEKVEAALQQAGVSGVSVAKVKGFGEYADFFERDWMTPHVRIEIFTSTERAEALARAIIDAAHTGLAGDGIVSLAPVDKVYRIRTRSLAAARTL
jgi:nitrogen regulatory protein P-II 1